MFSTLIKRPNVILVDSDEGESPGARALPMLESPEHSYHSPGERGSATSPFRLQNVTMLRRVSSGAEVPQAHRSLNLFPSIASRDVRMSTPLTLTVSQPTSYESDMAKRTLSERAMRARTRELQRKINGRLYDETFGLWVAVMSQKNLQDEKFAKLKDILGALQAHELKSSFDDWKDTMLLRKHVRKKVSKFLDWAKIRNFATAFVRWQVLWAGCCDCRPIKNHMLRRKDYDRPRMSIDQIRRWLPTDRGRNWLHGASEAENEEMFYSLCRSSVIDLETLADFTVEELVSEDGPNLPLPMAQLMYRRIKKLVTSDFSRLKIVLMSNPRTRLAIMSYLHMVDLIRQQVGQGIHPLGKTKKEILMEGHKDAEEEEEVKEFGDVKVDWKHIAIDFSVKLEGRVLQKVFAPAQSDFQASDWCRGYLVDFPDRIIGTLYLKSVFADLILWDESVAFCLVIDTDRSVMKRSKHVKGQSHLQKRYEFELDVEIHSGVAILVQVAPRLQSSKYSAIKDHVVERKLNPLITVRPVQCSKKCDFVHSQVQLQMWVVVDRRRGQEELDPGGETMTQEADYVPEQVFSDSEPEEEEEEEEEEGEEEEDVEQSPFPNKKKVTFPGREGLVMMDRQGKFKEEKGIPLPEDEDTISPLAKVNQYGGERLRSRDLITEGKAQFASAFNPKYSEFWIIEPFPSTYVQCMDYNGHWQRRIDLGCTPNCLHIDAAGRVYGCDFKQTFYKLMHERTYEKTLRMEVDRIYRLWYLNDRRGEEDRAKRLSTASGIAVHPKRPGVCYVAYSRGPIAILKSDTGERIGQIDPEPPLLGVSALVIASDVLVVGDSHQVKILTLAGYCISVLGDCYNEPCLMWTGLELFVAEKGSEVWRCFGAKQAKEMEHSQQKQRALRCRKYWSEKMPLRLCTPNTKVRVKAVQQEYQSAMDLDGRPLSRALGQSAKLAHHQGLMYYDYHASRYEPGKFFTQQDEDIRDLISELKEQHPDLPVDAGSLLRPS